MGRLTKRIFPISWNSAPTVSFTQGAASQVDLSQWLANPQGRAVVYAVVGALPSGVTLTGKSLAYNGSGAVASASVTFTATSGAYVVTSPSSSVSIAASQANQPPAWTIGDPYSLGNLTAGAVVNLAQYVNPGTGTPAYSITSQSKGGVAGSYGITVDPDAGLLALPGNITADSYAVAVSIDGGSTRTFGFS